MDAVSFPCSNDPEVISANRLLLEARTDLNEAKFWGSIVLVGTIITIVFAYLTFLVWAVFCIGLCFFLAIVLISSCAAFNHNGRARRTLDKVPYLPQSIVYTKEKDTK